MFACGWQVHEIGPGIHVVVPEKMTRDAAAAAFTSVPVIAAASCLINLNRETPTPPISPCTCH
jgi:hypothetical protein